MPFMPPNASCASTSKGVRSSSRASGISSMTRMDSLPRSTKDRAKWWDTKRERWRYEWNQNGTLKAVKAPHRSNWVEFTYDALGRRLSKLASEYTHWVWNGNVPLHEWNSSREWKDDGWQHYELETSRPGSLIMLGTPQEASIFEL